MLLCGLAALGPPGCGLAGVLVAVQAARAGYLLLVLAALCASCALLFMTAAGLELVRRTIRSGLVRVGTSRHAAPPPLPPGQQDAAPQRVAYGRI